MKTKMAGLLSILALLAGCTTMHRGVVAMKIDETTAHVGLNKSEVAVGDHVQLFGNKCTNTKSGQNCKKISKGHGVITEILSDDYAAVKFDTGVAFQEGDFIEKHSH
jgi:hypothetical protein